MIFDKETGMVASQKFEDKANRLHSNDSYNLAIAMFEHRDLYLNREELSRLTGIDIEGIKSRIGTLRNNGFLFDNASPSTKVPGRWKMVGIKNTDKPAIPKQENNKFGNLLNSVFGMGELNYEG